MTPPAEGCPLDVPAYRGSPEIALSLHSNPTSRIQSPVPSIAPLPCRTATHTPTCEHTAPHNSVPADLAAACLGIDVGCHRLDLLLAQAPLPRGHGILAVLDLLDQQAGQAGCCTTSKALAGKSSTGRARQAAADLVDDGVLVEAAVQVLLQGRPTQRLLHLHVAF